MSAATPLPARGPDRPSLRRVAHPLQGVRAHGEGMLWLAGGGLVLAMAMITGLLLLVFGQGIGTFWPHAIVQLELHSGARVLGEVTRTEDYTPEPTLLAGLQGAAADAARARMAQNGNQVTRRLLRTGNFDITHEHYRWVSDFEIKAETTPPWALVLEREEWGRFYGRPTAFIADGAAVATEPIDIWNRFEQHHDGVRDTFARRQHISEHGIGRLAKREEQARLHARRVMLRCGADAPATREAAAEYERIKAACAVQRQELSAEIAAIDKELGRYGLQMTTAEGQEKLVPLATIVRGFAPNQLTTGGKTGVYFDRWGEFLGGHPRNANTEGGVFPAIFGTVLMTLLMSVLVVPFGVLAALYMREYAKGGVLISIVRVAVNNLAGVPSIVFGAFGFGFFCYVIGGWVDETFYPEILPSPTFGKGALIWASFTLALLTLPVVIVATEEALAAVPGSMREGSYGCGASKWQTIRRIVLPRAMPGIMTGMILAMARGAGEVAPLMLVGAAKAPVLPLDGEAPFLHPSRSFMHLGFQIYDLGFQSQNSEAAKPMVFSVTLLLIATIALLNVLAIWLRSRLRRRFVANQF